MTMHDEDCGCDEYNELSRRQFIADSAGMSGLAMFASVFPSWLPKVVLSESYVADRDVIISIFLRGGADGLSMCVPFGDANYYTGRPTIAIPRPDSTATATRGIALDDFFALPRAMQALVPAYQTGQLLIVHATGSVDPTRSHFDAQKFIEVGKPRDPNIVTGWLGRHLATVPPMRTDAPLRALGFASGLQKTLVGGPKTLPISDPATFGISGATATRTERTNWLKSEYGPAPEPLRSSSLDALNTIELLRLVNITGYAPANGAVYPNNGVGRALRSAAALIKADIGIEAAQVDVGGWDTHATQDPVNPGGAMYNNMLNLANALGAFHADVIAGPTTTNVTVVLISEFGRNVRENSARGTDHGRGNCMFLMGRNISGGRVYTFNWPGLAMENLQDRQDLKVTLDHRDILAEIVKNRLGNQNLDVVFPGYVPTMRGVTK
jgi:uncharacterized protein (DUF1501 family)